MLWQRKVIEKTVEVPYIVLDADTRTRGKKWEDVSYLKSVRDFGRNTVFITESMHVLEQMREKADSAATPEELKGYTECIKVLKSLVYAPFFANKKLEAIESMAKQAEGE